ncbi:hypothetical protein DVG79_15785 [Exiguobacterium sp. RIT594]|nr:hypothetical protein DVG79_15785 [Exiguobacterium sp. RIT594]
MLEGKIDRLIKKHVVTYQEDWYDMNLHFYRQYPYGLLLLRRHGVEYFCGAKCEVYERETFHYYFNQQVTEQSDRNHFFRIDEEENLRSPTTARQVTFEHIQSKRMPVRKHSQSIQTYMCIYTHVCLYTFRYIQIYTCHNSPKLIFLGTMNESKL